jgi:tetratricopeptide (TPR) repeat protein
VARYRRDLSAIFGKSVPMPRKSLPALSSLACIVIAVAALALLCGSSAEANDFDQGVAALVLGRNDLAIRSMTKVLRKNPKSYAAHVNRGTAYFRSGRVFKGVLDWNKARDLSPLFAYGVYTGEVIVRAGRNPDELGFVASVELDPEYISSVEMTGIMLMDLGWDKKAAELYRMSMDLTKNPLLKTHLEYWAATLAPSLKKQRKRKRAGRR